MSEQTRVIVLGNGLHSIPTLAVLSGNTLGALCAVAIMSSAGAASGLSIAFIVTTYLLSYPLLMAANWLYLHETRAQALTVLQNVLFAAMCIFTTWTVDYALYKAFQGAGQNPQTVSSAALPLQAQGFPGLAGAVLYGPRISGSTHYRATLKP